ncbi:MAG TPA: hypothetical protein EYO82_01370, partial [Gammaproteobacteria bacterium]|nr:hypothetical protein [Gammaproteobacteria bacterium]
MRRRKLIFLSSDTFFAQAVLRRLVQAGALIMRVITPSLPLHVEVGFPVPQRQPHGLAAICGSLGIPLETIDSIQLLDRPVIVAYLMVIVTLFIL